MKTLNLIFVLAACALSASGQTDAYLKLYDSHGAHPRISSITFPGDANTLDMYNSIYGHGAVIENPWVAYRVYMDNRQSLDLYVKQTPRLELETTGFYTTPDQMAAGYGCDVLWAGKSIGAGSFRGWQDGRPVTIDTVASRTQQVVSCSGIEVFDKDWVYNGKKMQMRQTYAVDSASRNLHVKISLEGYGPDDVFCTGVQKLERDNVGSVIPDGTAYSWGANVPDKNHPEIVETVGLGIVVAPVNVAGTVEDELNYLILVKPDSRGEINYTVIAGGSREKDGFASSGRWFEHVQKQRGLSCPGESQKQRP